MPEAKPHLGPSAPAHTVSGAFPRWAVFLRRLRWQLGLSQTAFADHAGIDLAEVRAIERDALAPGRVTLELMLRLDGSLTLIAHLRLASAVRFAA